MNNAKAAASEAVLDLQDVSLIRGSATLVGPVTWQVMPDERWAIIGPNGAGKSSLISIAAAENHPSKGKAFILGEQVGKTDMRDLRTMIGTSSASLGARIPENEKVSDLVVSAGYAVLGRWREDYDEVDYDHAIEVLEEIGAIHLADRTWGTLSEGERKRVMVARAIMTDPELLIFDEPSAGMDLGGREDLVAYLSKVAADPDAPAAVMITHHVEEIPTGFTHCMLLDEGKVVAQGPMAKVLTAKNLTKAFHQPIGLEKIDGRYFARRVTRSAAHRK